MTRLEEINLLTLDEPKLFLLILQRVLGYEDGEAPYDVQFGEGNLYDRITLREPYTKPLYSELEAELAVYKTEEIAIENARIAEEARKNDLLSRWTTLKEIDGGNPWFYDNVSDVQNAEKYIKDQINDESKKDEIAALFTQMESDAVIQSSKVSANNFRSIKKEKGKAARRVCDEVLNLIAGFNLERELTTEQIDQMKTLFASVKEYLIDGQPWAAKAAVETITADGTIVTLEMKESILEEFTESGLIGL